MAQTRDSIKEGDLRVQLASMAFLITSSAAAQISPAKLTLITERYKAATVYHDCAQAYAAEFIALNESAATIADSAMRWCHQQKQDFISKTEDSLADLPYEERQRETNEWVELNETDIRNRVIDVIIFARSGASQK